METILETVDVDIEETNELFFRINIEGAPHDSPAKVRVVCEGEGVSYMFSGQPTKELGTACIVTGKQIGRAHV